VAHNKLVDRYRREASRPKTSSLDEFSQTLLGQDDQEPEHLAVRDEDRAQLYNHLARLTVEQQEVLHLRFTESLSTREIARLLNKSDVAVRSALARALNHLRRICEPGRKEK
jgi:RNA polymerase sigma-70 factor (ECF subfamily)